MGGAGIVHLGLNIFHQIAVGFVKQKLAGRKEQRHRKGEQAQSQPDCRRFHGFFLIVETATGLKKRTGPRSTGETRLFIPEILSVK
jgi:hypothetical protein